MNTYLQLLEESLRKKLQILDRVQQLGERQQVLLERTPFNYDEFDASMNEKEALAQEIEKLDDGFEKVYDRIRSDVLTHKEVYADQIRSLQQLISQVTEKSVTIQAMESRIRLAVDAQVKRDRKDLQQKRSGTKAARSYYESMRRLNFIDAQFMDQKK